MNNATHYNSVAKILHWWVAAMIVLQFVLAKLAERAEDNGSQLQQLALLANHKSVGITILAIALVRLVWRFTQPTPAPLPMPAWQRVAAAMSHWSLYALLFLLPVTGWLMSSASAFSVSWFNLVQLPDFVAADPDLKERLESIHKTLAKALLIVAGVHVAGALKHAVIDKDGALRRISSPMSLMIFGVVLAGGLFTLAQAPDGAQPSSPVAPNNSSPLVNGSEAAPQDVIVDNSRSALTAWSIDYAHSYIRFTGDQAGAEFTGEWRDWSADIRLTPGALEQASFNVTIEIDSVDTGDSDRDNTMLDAEWFNQEEYPLAYFRANEFLQDTNGAYVANGMIEIKANLTPAELEFTLQHDGNEIALSGQTTLDRLSLGVGTGEWLDTEWVGQFVDVQVYVEATILND